MSPTLKLCRFCTKQVFAIEVISLLNTIINREIQLILEFLRASYIDLQDQDLPNTICKPCYDSLKQAYIFLDKAKESQIYLKQQLPGLYKLDDPAPFTQIQTFEPIYQNEIKSQTNFANTVDGFFASSLDMTCDSPLPLIVPDSKPKNELNQSVLQEYPFMDLSVLPPSSESLSTECHNEQIISITTSANTETNISQITTDSDDCKSEIGLEVGAKLLTIENNDTKDVGLKKTIKMDMAANSIGVYAGLSIFDEHYKLMSEKIGQEKTWADLMWYCRHCSNKNAYKSFKELRDHSKKKHKMCNALYCTECNLGFDYFKDLIKHMRWNHYEELKFYCPYCNLQLQNEIDRKQHRKLHKEIEYSCIQCGEQFKTITHLAAHKRKFKVKRKRRNRYEPLPTKTPDSTDETCTGYKWSCLDCEDIFPNVETLRKHSQTVHVKCFSMKCADCLDVLDGYVAFVMHVRRHRPYLKNFCHYCNYKFKTPDEEASHVFQHFDRKVLTSCDCCGEIFQSPAELQHHIALYNPRQPKAIPYKKRERPLTIDDLTCDVCKKITKNLDLLRAHKRVHTVRQRNHTCETCGKAFYSKTAVTAHIAETHPKSKDHVCGICKMAFATTAKLQRHVTIHTGAKPFKCDSCDKSFRLKEQLKSHWIVHTDKMPFQCLFCDKKFRFATVLKTHQTQHTGERPYKCTECDMDFTNASNRNKHFKRKHGNSDTVRSWANETMKFKCGARKSTEAQSTFISLV